MAFNILAGAQYVQQQGEIGRQRGEGQFINKLLGEAYNAPDAAARKSALARLAGGGQAQVAMQADQGFRKQDAQMTEDAFKRLQTHAKMIRSVPAEQRANVWAQIQPRIAQELPEYAQYLPSQWDEAAVMPVVEQLASMGGESGGPTVRSSFVGADGNMYSILSDGSVKAQGIGADRKLQAFDVPGVGPQVVDLRNATARTVTAGGAPNYGQPPQQSPASTFAFTPAAGTEGDPDAAEFQNLAPDQQAVAARLLQQGQDFNIQNGRVVPSGMRGGQPMPQPMGNKPPTLDQIPMSEIGGGAIGAPGAAWVRPVSSAQSGGPKPPSGYRALPDGTLQAIPGGPADQANKPKAQDKPLPVGALRLQIDAKESLSVAQGVDSLIGGLLGDIDSGTLDLGPVKNLAYEARNFAGESTPQSRAYGTFKAGLEKLRNDSLRLNKGVQTDGDAQRAWNELMANINDTAFVRKRLEEIRQINQRGEKLQREKLSTIDRNYQGKEAAPAEDDISDLLEQYGDAL